MWEMNLLQTTSSSQSLADEVAPLSPITSAPPLVSEHPVHGEDQVVPASTRPCKRQGRDEHTIMHGFESFEHGSSVVAVCLIILKKKQQNL